MARLTGGGLPSGSFSDLRAPALSGTPRGRRPGGHIGALWRRPAQILLQLSGDGRPVRGRSSGPTAAAGEGDSVLVSSHLEYTHAHQFCSVCCGARNALQVVHYSRPRGGTLSPPDDMPCSKRNRQRSTIRSKQSSKESGRRVVSAPSPSSGAPSWTKASTGPNFGATSSSRLVRLRGLVGQN
jgi:hypothetical protein